jgi:hypothetical protein
MWISSSDARGDQYIKLYTVQQIQRSSDPSGPTVGRTRLGVGGIIASRLYLLHVRFCAPRRSRSSQELFAPVLGTFQTLASALFIPPLTFRGRHRKSYAAPIVRGRLLGSIRLEVISRPELRRRLDTVNMASIDQLFKPSVPSSR